MQKYIPNVLTSFNLLLGWTSVYFAFQGNVHIAIISILLASFFDYLDGFAARKLNAQSELGAQLDSFADLITFGIAPAIIIYNVTSISITFKDNILDIFLFVILGLVPLFGAIRLAKFNTIKEKSVVFIGLPIPAFALITISLTWIYVNYNPIISKILNHEIYFLSLVIFFSSLMVSNLIFLSLKFNDYKFKNNKFVFIWIILSIISLFILIISGNILLFIPIVLFLYLLFSIINNFVK
jgi:CDP-diacylglycerol--serine O-phosphatidyltransferase